MLKPEATPVLAPLALLLERSTFQKGESLAKWMPKTASKDVSWGKIKNQEKSERERKKYYPCDK